MFTIRPILLQGNWILLEPLKESHRDALYQAAQNEKIWSFISTSAFGERFHPWFDKAMKFAEGGTHFPYVVRRQSDQQIIGSTRFYDISAEHHRLMVGHTWYIPEMWGSFVNPECKYLLLKHAFEELKINRVELATDARNLRSRAAIQKLGAKEEGLLRQHMILENGRVRDTVIFSIIQPDWPKVKTALMTRLEQFT